MFRSSAWGRKRSILCSGRQEIRTTFRRHAEEARAAEPWQRLAAWFRWQMEATMADRCGIRRIFAAWWDYGRRRDESRIRRLISHGNHFRFPEVWPATSRTSHIL